MSSAAGGQQQQDNSLDFLWMIVLIIGIVLVTWYFARDYISAAVLDAKFYEILVIKFVVGFWNSIVSLVHLPQIDLTALNEWSTFIKSYTGHVDFPVLVKVNTAVGKFMRYPFTLLLLFLAAFLYFGSISLKFKQIYTMKKLRESEKVNWPLIMPVINLDLVKTDLDELPWAMAQSPMAFCKQNGLIKEEIKDGKKRAELVRDKAHRVLCLQLGALWRGPEFLPEHVKALFGIFAARTIGDNDAVDKLLDQIAVSSVSGNLNFSGADKLIAKHCNAKPIVKVMQSHAYVYTVMASMLDLARSAGVFATAEIIWLRPIDRKLWYVLNNVGRQTAWVEVAGVFSHWLAEQKLGWPIKTPMVDEALKGLGEALNEVLYEPEEN